MITREELEKMIESGEIAWLKGGGGLILNKNCKVLRDGGNDWLFVHECPFYLLTELYKTKEETEWILKTHTKREERFEPPHWNEIDKSTFWEYSFVSAQPYYYGKITVGVDIDVEYGAYCSKYKYESFGSATKENYEKAVDFARKLFLEGAE